MSRKVHGPARPSAFGDAGQGGPRRASDVPLGSGRGPPPETTLAGPVLTLDASAGDYIKRGTHPYHGENMTRATHIPAKCACPTNDVLERRLEGFERFLVRVKRSKRTAKQYARAVRWAARTVGGKDPVEWDTDDLKALMASPEWAGWSNVTRSGVKNALRSYWKANEVEPPKFVEFDMFRKRPYGESRSSRYHELKAQTPSQAEVEKVRAACRSTIMESSDPSDIYNAFATLLVASYGLRCTDASSVRVQDLNFDTNVLHVPCGKGNKARDMVMDVPIKAEFERFMAARSLLVARSVFANKSSLLERAATLFFIRNDKHGRGGSSETADALGNLVPDFVAKVLGRHVNAHAFRHAKVFELLEVMKIPLETASRYVGHASVTQTMEYLWADVDAQKNAFANAVNVTAAPKAEPAPKAGSDKASVVAALADLVRQGLLTDESFRAALAALQ